MNQAISKLPRVLCVVPCYNEEESLSFLIDEFKKVRKGLLKKISVELMLVNDGSSDGTQKLINEYAEKNDFIYYRQFARNAGHQSALRAGIDAADGYDAVIMMDADLQHPPSCIPAMIKEWQDNKIAIVQMLRDDSREDVGYVKWSTSKGYYWLINKLSGLGLEYGSSDFRLIDKSVVKVVKASSEKDLFLRGYFSWLNASRSTIKYRPNARVAGQSKYTFRKMLALAKKGILQFSEKPLRIATNLGSLIALASFLYGLFLIVSHLAGAKTVSGWTSLMVVMLFCFGVNFILIGMLGRYLAHSIEIQKQRPDYIVATERLPTV